jgi:ABC-type glycerol-3-phosphate transport system permease component
MTSLVGRKRLTFSRVAIYATLLVAVAMYLVPLVVMLLTSFKTPADIRTGNLLSWPDVMTVIGWVKAWDAVGGYFWNSVKITVCLIWQFTQIWNDFLFGVVFASGDTQPITVALNNLVNTSTGAKEYNVDMAAAMIAGLPTLVVYVLAGKYFLRGLTAGAVKG